MNGSANDVAQSLANDELTKPANLRADVMRLMRTFEEKAGEYDGVEAWSARDLQKLLSYSEWKSFARVVSRAKEACRTAGILVEDHFIETSTTIEKDDGSFEEGVDIVLTRYAAFLVAQNGDPHKAPIAFAQTYFALQTRKQEVLEERLAERERMTARNKLSQTERELSGVLYERDVDDKGFAIVRSKGDAALFDGLSTNDMKRRLNVPESRALADFLPTVTIKAKDLAAEITNHMVKATSIRGVSAISGQHVQSNSNVRRALVASGIRPEALPPAEDIKKVERRHKSDAKSLAKDTLRLTGPSSRTRSEEDAP